MQKHLVRLVILVLLTAVSLWLVVPPSQKLRLGRDLRGGISLVYSVRIPSDAVNPEEMIKQVIEVLKQRINPQGVLDLTISPIGRDRIELVMPLPGKEVRELQVKFNASVAELMKVAKVDANDLETALQAGRVPVEFAAFGDKAKKLQDAHDAAAAARAALDQARQSGDQAKVAELETTIARSEISVEQLRGELLAANLSQARIERAVRLPSTPQRHQNPDGTPARDDRGLPIWDPSQREQEITAIEQKYPQIEDRLPAVLAAWDAYAARRTGLDDPDDLQRMLRGAGVLEFRLAVPVGGSATGVSVAELREQMKERGPQGVESAVAGWFKVNDVRQWADTPAEKAALERDPQGFFAQRGLEAVTYIGEPYVLLYKTEANTLVHSPDKPWVLSRAGHTVDDLGRPAVSFELDQAGGLEMSRLTGGNEGRHMAIVLDGEVYSAPVLNSAIGSRGIIQGSFDDEQLRYLIRVLAAGSLEARLSSDPISRSILGPSLGTENLVHGLDAALYSVIAVVLMMTVYYFLPGVVANFALIINALMIFGIMAYIDGMFTLPGFAGIALTMGMAVDSNVLIYERIREEVANNKEELHAAVRIGYKRALSAIVDGNVTNLIVCVVLYLTATTEVKGFALTMGIGVVTTLFTSIYISRWAMDFYTEAMHGTRFPILSTVFPAVRRALEPHIDWVSKRMILNACNAVIAVVAIALFASRGADVLDTEFRGGVSMTLQTRNATPQEKTAGLADAEGHLLLERGAVSDRVRAIAERHPGDPIAATFSSASVLTQGAMTADFKAAAFQIKVGNPPGMSDEESVAGRMIKEVIDEFRPELEVTLPLTFAGVDDPNPARFTYGLERDTLAQAIDRTDLAGLQVGRFRGGVAVILDHVDPPATVDDIENRLRRERNKPDFSDTAGRESGVFGIGEAVEGEKYSAFVEMVRDEVVDSRRVDTDTWNRELATREWHLAQAALTRGDSLEQVNSFSPAVAQSLADSAIVAVALSLLLMLVYIWARFGSFRYSASAVIALLFNIICCLGALALSAILSGTTVGRLLLMDTFRIDLNVVAALLTIVGYSLNDTIVILDRVRENRGKLPLASAKVINDSINQTFSRTILTGGSTILSAAILYVLGGPAIQPFAFTFLVGLIVGTYSSVAIAAPMVYDPKVKDPAVPERALATVTA